MKNVLKKFSDTNLRVNCRFSFAHVFEAAETPSGDKKYSCCLLIDKSDTKTVEAIKAAIEAAKQLGKSSKWGGKIPGNVKTCLRDGDVEREDDPSAAGMFFINASSKRAPGVKIIDGGQIVDALDEQDFYSGCYGAAEINFYPYDASGSRGVTAGLNNVVKLEDGEKMSGAMSADEAFGDLC